MRKKGTYPNETIKIGDKKRGEEVLTAVGGPLEQRDDYYKQPREMFERIQVDDESRLKEYISTVQNKIIMESTVQDKIIMENRVEDKNIMENRVEEENIMKNKVQEEEHEEVLLSFISPSLIVVPEMSSLSMDGSRYEFPFATTSLTLATVLP